MQSSHSFLPPPLGVEVLEAFEDDLTGEWHVERLPLVCINVLGDGPDDGFDAMSIDGTWLHGNKALLLPDGRVVRHLDATWENMDNWLAEVKKRAESFNNARLFVKAQGASVTKEGV